MTALLVYVDGSGVQHSVSSLALGSSVAKSVYLGSTKIWTAPTTATWIKMTSGNTYVAAYKPATNISVSSFSRISNIATLNNCVCGIWTLSGGNLIPVTNACFSGTTGITVTPGTTTGTYQQQLITKTYTTKPALIAGTTYYFYVGERYVDQYTLSGTCDCPGYAPDWAFSASASMSFTASDIGNIYLNVVSA